MKRFKTLAIALTAALLASPALAQTALKIGHGHSEAHSFHLSMQKFGEILEQKAPGAFKVTLFPQARLGSEREMQEQLTTGTLEMTITGVLGIFEPKITLLELPFLFRDRAHIQKGQQSAAVEQGNLLVEVLAKCTRRTAGRRRVVRRRARRRPPV